MSTGRAQVHLVANQPIDNSGDWPLRFPAAPQHFGESAAEVTFMIHIRAVLGAPTAWKLEARQVVRVPHVGGPNSGGFQWRDGYWVPMDSISTAKCVVEGVGWYTPGYTAPASAGDWGTIADNATYPGLAKANFYTSREPSVTAMRTVTHFGQDTACELRLTLTGGTSPKISVSATTFPRG